MINDGTIRFIVRTIKDTAMTGDVAFRPYLAVGWAKAVGETVNRSDYPTLVKFANDYDLWTDTPAEEPWKFGNSDGRQTMVLPDYRGRVIQGGDTVEAREAGLPNIEGYFDMRKWNTDMVIAIVDNKLFQNGEAPEMQNSGTIAASPKTMTRTSFDASKSNPIYGSSETVQPPAIVLIPQIKI